MRCGIRGYRRARREYVDRQIHSSNAQWNAPMRCRHCRSDHVICRGMVVRRFLSLPIVEQSDKAVAEELPDGRLDRPGQIRPDDDPEADFSPVHSPSACLAGRARPVPAVCVLLASVHHAITPAAGPQSPDPRPVIRYATVLSSRVASDILPPLGNSTGCEHGVRVCRVNADPKKHARCPGQR